MCPNRKLTYLAVVKANYPSQNRFVFFLSDARLFWLLFFSVSDSFLLILENVKLRMCVLAWVNTGKCVRVHTRATESHIKTKAGA